MVVEDGSWEWGSLNVMLPGAEGANDTEEFSIVDLIVSFGRRKGLEKEGTRMPFIINIVLVKNSTCSGRERHLL